MDFCVNITCNSSHLADSLHALFVFPMYLPGGAPPDVLSWVTTGIILFSGGKGPRMANLEVMRAEAEWQRAGAYSVRIQGMNRQHHISLRDEFDEHDGEGTKYIVLLDKGYPVATCRFYEVSPDTVVLGRVVVLPEYRGDHTGSRVVEEAEKWIRECGYARIVIDSRTEVVPFYEKLGYVSDHGETIHSGVFDCLRMHKDL